MSDYGNFIRWCQRVGLTLLDHSENDLTSADYPDLPQEAAHAGEIPFEVDEDKDPTLQLTCDKCGKPFRACDCKRGPRKFPPMGSLPFDPIAKQDELP